MKGVRGPAGFTLIELMVTIAILALLLLLAMPFTRHWVDGVKQMRTRNLLVEGVGQARALALRNPDQRRADQAAVTLRRVDGELRVLRGDAGEPAWAASLDPASTLKLAGRSDFGSLDAFRGSGDDFGCVAFNSRGTRLPDAEGCALVLTLERIAIGVGDQEPVYVELL